LITEEVVNGKASPLYWKEGGGVAFWEAWAHAEHLYTTKK